MKNKYKKSNSLSDDQEWLEIAAAGKVSKQKHFDDISSDFKIDEQNYDDDFKDHHPHIGKINNTSGKIDPLGGTIITINNVPYLQSELSELGIYAAFKSDSLFQVDSLNADIITCQPRILSPAGSVVELPHTNILFE